MKPGIVFILLIAFSACKKEDSGPDNTVTYPYTRVYVGAYAHDHPSQGSTSGVDTARVVYESADSFSIRVVTDLSMPDEVRFPNTADSMFFISSPATMSSGMFYFHDHDSLYIYRSIDFGGGFGETYSFDGKRIQ